MRGLRLSLILLSVLLMFCRGGRNKLFGFSKLIEFKKFKFDYLMGRKATVERKTRETHIRCTVDLDGTGNYSIDTPSGFFTHMLESLACHGRFDIQLTARGDTHVDLHHTVEDTGLTLGMAIDKALGDRVGIERAGFWLFPMDEALVQVAVDLGGRSYAVIRGMTFGGAVIGDFSADLFHDFIYGLSTGMRANIHVTFLYGRSPHHMLESAFKGLGKALHMATRITGKQLPTTKGEL